MNTCNIHSLFERWCQHLRITPTWDVVLEIISDANLRKTGDIKIDCTDHKAIVLLNTAGANFENPEEILVHELLHLKLYPLDQVTEGLIASQFESNTPASDFAYHQFFTALEITVEELTKCFLFEFGETKELSYGRCRSQKSFDDLYNNLKNL